MKINFIYKQYKDCVNEIIEFEKELKTFPQTIPTGEVGYMVKTYTLDYDETIAEIRKLMIIKKLTGKK